MSKKIQNSTVSPKASKASVPSMYYGPLTKQAFDPAGSKGDGPKGTKDPE